MQILVPAAARPLSFSDLQIRLQGRGRTILLISQYVFTGEFSICNMFLEEMRVGGWILDT